MAKKFDDAKVTGEYIADLIRRRTMAAVASHDAALGRSYEKLATSIRRDLRAAGYKPRQIRALLDKNLKGTLSERVRVVEGAILTSAREGRKLDRETFDGVFGDAGKKPTFATDSLARRVASERIRGKATVDGLSLSKRFHKRDKELATRLGSTLEQSVRAGESVTRTAERLLSEDKPIVRLPKYVQELAEAAPNKTEYAAAVKRWRGTVERLGQGAAREAGEYTIRSATQQLVKDLGKATPAEVEKAVDRWVLERARHQARVIARHESVEAFRESALESWKDQEWVVAVQWKMSGSHPKPDICDVVANQDLYGLGPGCYPKDQVPERHVSCMCTQSAVSDPYYFDREIAREKGEEEPPKPWESGQKVTGDDWLRSQPDDVRKTIAGPTRSRLVMQGQSVMSTTGSFTPVGELLGERPAKKSLGVGIDARRLVAEDRARMVQPLPDLRTRTPAREKVLAKPARTARTKTAPRPRKAVVAPVTPAPVVEQFVPPPPPPKPAPEFPPGVALKPIRPGVPSSVRAEMRAALPDDYHSAVTEALDATGYKKARTAWEGQKASGTGDADSALKEKGWYGLSSRAHGEMGKWIFDLPSAADVTRVGEAIGYTGEAEMLATFPRAQYAATQEMLERRIAEGSIPEIDADGYVTLYRGIGNESAYKVTQNTGHAALAHPERTAPMRVSPLSSWTADRQIADDFAQINNGVIVRQRVHYSRIYSQWEQSARASGEAYRAEKEWIVVFEESEIQVKGSEIRASGLVDETDEERAW